MVGPYITVVATKQLTSFSGSMRCSLNVAVQMLEKPDRERDSSGVV